MPERTIDWGGSNSPYETHVDRDGNDRVILAEDTDGNTVLLEWDGAAGEWVYGGPVNMDGADVSNVGTLDASVIDVDLLNFDMEAYRNETPTRDRGTWYQNTAKRPLLVEIGISASASTDLNLNIETDSSASATNAIKMDRQRLTSASSGDRLSGTAIVRPGWYYRESNFESTDTSVEFWTESLLGGV